MITRIAFLGFLAVGALTGCAKQYDIVTAPEQMDMNHYLMVQATKSGGMKVWDCLHSPDGTAWDPTCVRVRMQDSVREE